MSATGRNRIRGDWAGALSGPTWLAVLEEQREIVLAKQTELEHAVANAPDWRLACDARARENEYQRQRAERMQLQRLREGTLLFAPNQVLGRIEDLDATIKESNHRIEMLRTQLATQLQHAEGLLSEPVTT